MIQSTKSRSKTRFCSPIIDSSSHQRGPPRWWRPPSSRKVPFLKGTSLFSRLSRGSGGKLRERRGGRRKRRKGRRGGMTDYGKWDAIASALGDSSDDDDDPRGQRIGGGGVAASGAARSGIRPSLNHHAHPLASSAASPMASMLKPEEGGDEFELVRWHCVSLLQSRGARYSLTRASEEPSFLKNHPPGPILLSHFTKQCRGPLMSSLAQEHGTRGASTSLLAPVERPRCGER